MKKLFLLAAIATFTLTIANAQFGVGVGYVNSVNKERAGRETSSHDAMNGFYAGFHYDIRLIAGLSVQPGINYSYMGYSESGTEMGVKLKLSWNEHFLNVPIDIKYTFNILPDLRVFAFAGPKAVLGLSSSIKATGKADGQKASASYNLYSGKIKTSGSAEFDPDDFDDLNEGGMLSRFDLQLGIGAGVQYSSYYLKFGYDWGLINRLKNTLGGGKLTRGQLYLGLGYIF